MNNIKFPTFRLIAVGYLVYLLGDLIVKYFQGGPDAPSLPLLLLSAVVLGGGATFVAIVSYKQWKKDKEKEAEEKAAKKAALEAAEEE